MMKNNLVPHRQYPEALLEVESNTLFIPFPEGIREEITEAVYLVAFREIPQKIQKYNGRFYAEMKAEDDSEIVFFIRRLKEATQIVLDRKFTNRDTIGILVSWYCSGNLPRRLRGKKYKKIEIFV